jgi:hypothetical protein
MPRKAPSLADKLRKKVKDFMGLNDPPTDVSSDSSMAKLTNRWNRGKLEPEGMPKKRKRK